MSQDTKIHTLADEDFDHFEITYCSSSPRRDTLAFLEFCANEKDRRDVFALSMIRRKISSRQISNFVAEMNLNSLMKILTILKSLNAVSPAFLEFCANEKDRRAVFALSMIRRKFSSRHTSAEMNLNSLMKILTS